MAKCRRCKIKVEKPIIAGIYSYCSFDCSYLCAMDNLNKANKKKLAKAKQLEVKKEKAVKIDLAKRKEAIKSNSEFNKEAQASINRYINLRDRNKNCVSCDCSLSVNPGGTTDCGHYRSRGSASHLRFNLLNMHSQCSRCNRYLSGNIVEYRKELIKRIGVKRVELLENDNIPRKFDIEYLKRIKRIFNKRARFYQKRRGLFS